MQYLKKNKGTKIVFFGNNQAIFDACFLLLNEPVFYKCDEQKECPDINFTKRRLGDLKNESENLFGDICSNKYNWSNEDVIIEELTEGQIMIITESEVLIYFDNK